MAFFSARIVVFSTLLRSFGVCLFVVFASHRIVRLLRHTSLQPFSFVSPRSCSEVFVWACPFFFPSATTSLFRSMASIKRSPSCVFDLRRRPSYSRSSNADSCLRLSSMCLRSPLVPPAGPKHRNNPLHRMRFFPMTTQPPHLRSSALSRACCPLAL